MIKCIIVDDEPLAQDIMEGYISRYGGLQLVAKCRNAESAFTIINEQAIDLMFLDIRMPGVNGIAFAEALKHPPQIIFTTAYAEHAAKGFELDAVDYLLKPVTFERFEKSLQKLFRIVPTAIAPVQTHTYFKVDGKLVKITHDDLLFAESVKDYVLLQTRTARFLAHMTMTYLSDLLPNRFIRVHRSYLVNKDHINIIGKTTLEVNGKTIPIGGLYRHYIIDFKKNNSEQ